MIRERPAEAQLLSPASGAAAPDAGGLPVMVDGTQYVVQAAGGHAQLGSTQGDYVVAFALPDSVRGSPGSTAS